MARRSRKPKKGRNENEAARPAADSQMQDARDSPSKPDSASDPTGPAETRIEFPMLPSLSRIMSVVMLIFGILAVGALFYRVMAGFFVPLFLAALLVVLFRPVHDWIFLRIGERRRLAALATTTLILSSVLLPVLLTISVAAGQFTAMVSQVNFNDLTEALERVRAQIGLSLDHSERFQRLDELTDSLDHPQNPERLLESIEEVRSHLVFLHQNVEGPATAEGAAVVALDRLAEFAEAVMQASVPDEPTDEANEPTDEVDEPTDEVDEPTDEVDESSEEVGESTDEVGESTEEVDESSEEAGEQGNERNILSERAADDSAMPRIDDKELFHRQSLSAAASIRTWMHAKLGGSLRSQLRLLANPSEQDFAALLSRARESLQPRFVSLTSATGGFLIHVSIGCIVLIIAVYFFLIDGPSMVRTLMRLSPLDDNYERRLLLEFDRTSRAVVLASVLSALAQGFLAAIAFYFLGFDSVILLFLITSLMALVPFLGAASVWFPCVIWLATVEQRLSAAVFLFIYGAAIVSTIDNVIKMFVLHGHSTLHPLFALLSVLGGVHVFGPIGILVGPMVVVFLQTLLEILNHELAANEPATLDA